MANETKWAELTTTTHALAIDVDGMTFVADHVEDEPRVLDVEIGKRVGLSRAWDIRRTIRKAIDDGFLKEHEDYRCRVQVRAEKANDSNQRARGALVPPPHQSTEYWLTETGALKVITRLNTPAAQAIVGDMIRVYREALRRLHQRAPDTAALESAAHWLALQHDPGRHNDVRRVGDIPAVAAELRERCGAAADVQSARLGERVTGRRVAGAIRAYFRVSSHLDVRLSAVNELRRLLDALTLGTMLVKSKRRPLLSDKRQLLMFVA